MKLGCRLLHLGKMKNKCSKSNSKIEEKKTLGGKKNEFPELCLSGFGSLASCFFSTLWAITALVTMPVMCPAYIGARLSLQNDVGSQWPLLHRD